jgi:hypothetical protein
MQWLGRMVTRACAAPAVAGRSPHRSAAERWLGSRQAASVRQSRTTPNPPGDTCGQRLGRRCEPPERPTLSPQRPPSVRSRLSALYGLTCKVWSPRAQLAARASIRSTYHPVLPGHAMHGPAVARRRRRPAATLPGMPARLGGCTPRPTWPSSRPPTPTSGDRPGATPPDPVGPDLERAWPGSCACSTPTTLGSSAQPWPQNQPPEPVRRSSQRGGWQ